MNTDKDLHQVRAGAGFPVDQPLEGLRKDHNLVKALVERFQTAQSPEAKNEAGSQILELLEIHSKLEEQVFYPRTQDVDPALIDHFNEEHAKTDDLLAQLKGKDLTDPQAQQMFQQLTEMTMHHIEEEEQQFFPKLEQSGMDMTELGVQMAGFEANLVTTLARASDQQGARPQ